MGQSMTRASLATAAAGLIAVLGSPFPAAAGAAGICLEQKPLPQGCVAGAGALGCTPVSQLDGAQLPTVSPDDQTVYLTTFTADTVVVLDRNPANGELAQLAGLSGCLSDTGSGGSCTDARNLDNPQNVAVSADFEQAYVSTNGISVFDRDVSTGALTQKAGTAGCINATGAEGCAVGNQVAAVSSVALSPDDENLYGTSYVADAVTVFDRDTVTGALTQKAGAAGCINEDGSAGCTDGVALDGPREVLVSPDGTSVYVISTDASSIAILDRNTTTGELTQKAGTDGCISDDGTGGLCADATAMLLPTSAAISPDGKNLYVVSGLTGSSVATSVFDRELATGKLTQKAGTAGCISNNGSGGLCADGRGLVSPRGISVSPDGEAVYVSMEDSNGVAIFQRDATTGSLSQVPGASGCINDNGSDGCAVGVGMSDSIGMAASGDNLSVYVGGVGDDALAVFDRVACPPTTTTTTTTTTTSTTTTSTTSTTLPAGSCAPSPRPGCRDQAGRSRIRMRDVGDPESVVLEFAWKRGEATAIETFGDPVAGATGYALCVYAAGAPVVELAAGAGGTCGSRPCWRTAGKRRFVYFDRAGAADGLRELVLRAGVDGEARVRAKARGVNLVLPDFPLVAPVRVQVVGGSGAEAQCWESEFTTLDRNTDWKVDTVK